MSSNLPDENIIREYLLGTLPEKDWNEIEEKLFSDKEFADFADAIEDQIIEEYLTIQNHFLRPPERQRKLLFATVLDSRLKKSASEPVPIDRTRKQRPPAPRFYGAMATAAALLLIATSYLTVYTAKLHNQVTTADSKIKSDESMLAQKSAELSNLKNEMGSHMNFIDLGSTLRDIGQSNEHPYQVTVQPGTKSLRVRLPVNGPISPPYSVELRKDDLTGEPRWSQDNLQPESGALIFVIRLYGKGHYYLNLSRRGNPPSPLPRVYPFEVVEQSAGSAAKH